MCKESVIILLRSTGNSILFSLVFVLVLYDNNLYRWAFYNKRGVKCPFHILLVIRIFNVIKTVRTGMNFSINCALTKLSNDICCRRISAIICITRHFPYPTLQ